VAIFKKYTNLMIIDSAKNKRKWQREFITTIFNKADKNEKAFIKIAFENPELLNKKNTLLPNYLFKYYSPTSENILDIQNQKLWLSDPKLFNDPFDCSIGYDNEKYDKDLLLQFILKTGCVEEQDKLYGFTIEDERRIINSRLGISNHYFKAKEEYSNAKYWILSTKSEDFQNKVSDFLNENIVELDKKISILRDVNIRIACFSEFDKYEEFFKQIVMWSHYADNHKGFCVEYDLELLKRDTQFSLADYEFYYKKSEYLMEKNTALIKAGLFPVEYTCNRINIPISKLKKLVFDSHENQLNNYSINKLIYKTFIVKSANWNYEKEWRLLVDGKISNFYDNKLPFPYAKKIYIGCKANTELIDTLIAIGKNFNIDVILLKMDSAKFILEDDPIKLFNHKREYKLERNPFV
jgi:hypothetical protein